MRRKIVDLGREMVVGFTKVDDMVYLDFFTKDGIKVINLDENEFANVLNFFEKEFVLQEVSEK